MAVNYTQFDKGDKLKPHTSSIVSLKSFHPLAISIGLIQITLLLSTFSSVNILGTRIWKIHLGLKYVPVILPLFAALWASLCIPFRSSVRTIRRALKTNINLTLFFLMSFLGSAYARFGLNITYSYFSQAILVLDFLFAYFVFASLPAILWKNTKRRMIRTAYLMTIIAVSGVLIEFGRGENANADTAIILAQGLVLNRLLLPPGLNGLVSILLSAFIFLGGKNTGIVMLFVTWVGLLALPKGQRRKFTLTSGIIILVAVMAASILIGGGYMLFRSHFSEGHTDFRMYAYQYQLYKFIESPLFGQLFTGDTSVLFGRDVVVPTHNDWIDVAAQGGIIGSILFLSSFVYILVDLYKKRNKNIANKLSKGNLITWQMLFLVQSMIAFTFNPILGKTDTASLIWIFAAFASWLTRDSYSKYKTIKNQN